MSVTSTVTNVVLVGSGEGRGEGGREGGKREGRGRGEEGEREGTEGGIDTETDGGGRCPFLVTSHRKSLTLLSGGPLCLWQ